MCLRVYNFWRIMFRSFFKRKMLHATERTGGSYFYCHWLCHCHCHHQLSVPVPVTAPVSFPFPLPIPDPPLITKVCVRVKVCLKSNRLDMKLGAVPSRLAAAAAATAAIGPRDRPSGSVGFIDISQMEHTKAVEKRNGKKKLIFLLIFVPVNSKCLHSFIKRPLQWPLSLPSF